MANKTAFARGPKGVTPPPSDTVNRAGGRAYKLGEKAALAQYAATGTFNDTYYSTAEAQVSEILEILSKVDVQFIAKTALYARHQGRMKDMPALLVAHLLSRGDEGRTMAKLIFLNVLDNGKMLRNFVQIMQSKVTGRKLTGTVPKKLIQSWFAAKQPADIFKMSVGNDPTMKDVLSLGHVTDQGSPERKALYAYLFNREHDFDSLPPLVKEYEVLKKEPASTMTLPKVPFEMLMGLSLTDHQWKELALQASWTQLRMSLNTFVRHHVFTSDAVTKQLAAKLCNAELIEKAKPFPYQLLTTYLNTAEGEVPKVMLSALHEALEIATKNVPTIEGPVYAAVDVSGSMQSPVTGFRAGATSKTRCVDAAALIGATYLRRNPESELLPFSDGLFLQHGCIAQDSIMTNAKKLAALGGGGTNMTAALAHLNKTKKKGNLVIVASDCETWDDSGYRGAGTHFAQAWAEYKSRNPKAKLVTINLQAGQTTQVQSTPDVLNIGGFSDSIWEVIKNFVEGVPSADYWVDVIEKISLPV